jgi:hypothetical protein
MDNSDGKNPLNGQFLPGNKFWLARSSHGSKPKFDNSDDLWSACCEYFQWVEDNPLFEDKVGFYEGCATHEPSAKMRAMTQAGLCFFIDVSQVQWTKWKTERPDLVSVITQAELCIKDQKFSGAAAGLLNANIIARDLGLADKNEHSGPDGGAIQHTHSITSILQSIDGQSSGLPLPKVSDNLDED